MVEDLLLRDPRLLHLVGEHGEALGRRLEIGPHEARERVVQAVELAADRVPLRVAEEAEEGVRLGVQLRESATETARLVGHHLHRGGEVVDRPYAEGRPVVREGADSSPVVGLEHGVENTLCALGGACQPLDRSGEVVDRADRGLEVLVDQLRALREGDNRADSERGRRDAAHRTLELVRLRGRHIGSVSEVLEAALESAGPNGPTEELHADLDRRLEALDHAHDRVAVLRPGDSRQADRDENGLRVLIQEHEGVDEASDNIDDQPHGIKDPATQGDGQVQRGRQELRQRRQERLNGIEEVPDGAPRIPAEVGQSCQGGARVRGGIPEEGRRLAGGGHRADRRRVDEDERAERRGQLSEQRAGHGRDDRGRRAHASHDARQDHQTGREAADGAQDAGEHLGVQGIDEVQARVDGIQDRNRERLHGDDQVDEQLPDLLREVAQERERRPDRIQELLELRVALQGARPVLEALSRVHEPVHELAGERAEGVRQVREAADDVLDRHCDRRRVELGVLGHAGEPLTGGVSRQEVAPALGNVAELAAHRLQELPQGTLVRVKE